MHKKKGQRKWKFEEPMQDKNRKWAEPKRVQKWKRKGKTEKQRHKVSVRNRKEIILCTTKRRKFKDLKRCENVHYFSINFIYTAEKEALRNTN